MGAPAVALHVIGRAEFEFGRSRLCVWSLGTPAVVEFGRSRLDCRAEFETLTLEFGDPAAMI